MYIYMLLSNSEFGLPELAIVLCYASKYHSLRVSDSICDCDLGSSTTVKQRKQGWFDFCVE